MRTPRPPDRCGPPFGAAQRPGRAVGLLPAPPPDGSQQPFFFLVRPAALSLLDRAKSTDLFVEDDQVLAEPLEAVKFGDLLLGLAQGGGIGKSFRHGLAGHPASETKLRFTSRVVMFGAVAGRLGTENKYANRRVSMTLRQVLTV